MKHIFLSFFFIAIPLKCMELVNSSALAQQPSSEENEEFNFQFQKLHEDRKKFIACFLVQSEDQQSQLARTIYQNPQSVLSGRLEHDESLALFTTLKLLGHPNEPRSEEFKSLPQPLRALIEKFKIWTSLYQNEAILTDIVKYPSTKQLRPEFNNLNFNQYRALTLIFEAMGYNIWEPEKSRSLVYKSLEQIKKIKEQQIEEQKKRLNKEDQ